MNKIDEKADQLKAEIDAIGLDTMRYSLADAIREGSSITSQACGWGDGESACALTAAVIAAKARGYA